MQNYNSKGIPRKFILLNGPSKTGKDECGLIIRNWLNTNMSSYRADILSISDKIKYVTHEFFTALNSYRDPPPVNAFELIKDKPHAFFEGMSPREAYIWLSDDVVKRKFGKHYWVELYLKDVNTRFPNSIFIINPGIGCKEEFDYLLDNCDSQNILLLRLHVEGQDFKNDSRHYLYSSLLDGIDVLIPYISDHETRFKLQTERVLNHAIHFARMTATF